MIGPKLPGGPRQHTTSSSMRSRTPHSRARIRRGKKPSRQKRYGMSSGARYAPFDTVRHSYHEYTSGVTNPMASLSNGRTGLASSVDATRMDPSYFAVFGLSLVLLNIFTFLYHLSFLSIFNAVSNAISVGLIAYSIRTIFRAQSDDSAGRMYLLSAVVMTSLSVIFNWKVASTTDALKYLSIYIFYAAGRAAGRQIRPIELRCFYALAALPIIFLATGSSKVFADESFFSEIFAYLPNANTAVLYFSSLLFAPAQHYRDRVILLQFINALLMNMIGAVVATVVALCLCIDLPLR